MRILEHTAASRMWLIVKKFKGMLEQSGFEFADEPDNADFILFNTCAVREHAEDRVFGNVGALKNSKA